MEIAPGQLNQSLQKFYVSATETAIVTIGSLGDCFTEILLHNVGHIKFFFNLCM